MESVHGSREETAVHVTLSAGDRRDHHRHSARPFHAADGRGDEAARRRLHQADQDDHCADHLLHGRRRHCRHGGHEESRQDGRLCAALFRDRQHDRADRRAHDRQPRAAGRRHERRSGDARPEGHRRVHEARADGEHDGLPAERHSEHRRRRVRQRRDPAGAAVRRALRLRAAQVRRPRHAGVRLDREDVARAVLDRRLHHAGRTDRRVRRDGVHDRQVRRRLARAARAS